MKETTRSLGWVFLIILGACSSSDGNGDGNGGSGGMSRDEVEAISFDDENAIPVASANAVAVAVSAELGTLLGSALGALAEGATGFAEGSVAKQQGLDVTCPGGGIVTLSYGTVAVGEEARLEFTDCVGSVFSASPLNGTITLDIEAVVNTGLGTLPSEGTATVDLRTADGNTTITGTFKVIVPAFSANLPLEFGNDLQTDLLRIERNTAQGTQTIEFRCFRIRMTIALGFSSGPSIASGTIVDGSFEPTGIAILNGTDVFTLGTREPLSFTGAVARSGSIENTTGNQRASATIPGFCDSIGLTTPGDGSFVAVEFANEQCVAVSGIDANNETFEYETTWGKLVNADFTPGGATCNTTTNASPGPDTCDLQGPDRLPIADTYITGTGPEPDRMLADTNFGTNSLLLTRSVPNLGFTRKTYLVFDLGDLSANVQSATLVLTLQRHVVVEGFASGPQPFNFYGITDDDDWDPDTLPEDQITWNNAPKNLNDSVLLFEQSPGVPLLIPGYDFMLGGDFDQDNNGIDDDGTRYAFDLTDYINERIENDADGKVTILMAHRNPTGANVNTSVFFAKENPGDECDRPFLRLE
jgi:hypothetical protein